MRETRFIEQNKQKWGTFEKSLNAPQKDAEDLSNQFINVTDDLSYARTFYPNRSVREYLNSIAQKVFYSVYKNRKSRVGRFWAFWKTDVPQIIWESRREFLFSFFIFLGAMLIGMFSTYMDPEFPRVILGNEYVDMTYRNIEEGRPMSVYSTMNEGDMFLQIALNNLYVSFVLFILGLLFGVGTISRLIFNGVMLGAFQALFFREGIYTEMLLTLWLHGAIEISCIVIAGAGGLTLGKGLTFPGTYTRRQSLQLAARRGLLIMLTIAPLIVLAAFIESFFTRHTGTPDVIRGAVVFGSFAFIFFYFVWYPWRTARRQTSFLRDVNLPASREEAIDFSRTKSLGLIFGDTFNHFRQQLRPLFGAAALCTAAYVFFVLQFRYEFVFSSAWTLGDAFDDMFYNVSQFLFPQINNWGYDQENLLYIANWIVSSIMVYLFLHSIQAVAHRGERAGLSYYFYTLLATPLVLFIFQFTFSLEPGWIFIFIIFLYPMLALWLSVVFNERRDPFTAIGRSFAVIYGNYWNMNLGYWIVLGLCMVFLFISTAPILGLYFQIISTALPIPPSQLPTFHQGFYTAIHVFMMALLLPLTFGITSIGFFSHRETSEARDLKRRVEQIGLAKRSYGMERE